MVESDANLALGGVRVLIVPTTSQMDRKERLDVVISCPPAPQRECLALIGHVQPVLRSDLQHLVQRLPDDWLDRILAALIEFIGVPIEPGDDEPEEP